MQSNYSNAEVVYAGFWVRLFAYLIDSVIVFMGLFVIRLFFVGMASFIQDTIIGGNLLFSYSIKDIVLYMFQVVYFILFTYFCGVTPGKRLMNLRVISSREEETLSLVDVLYRETVGRFLCSVIMCIGYIMIGVDREKKGIHDILCNTRVIYTQKAQSYQECQNHV